MKAGSAAVEVYVSALAPAERTSARSSTPYRISDLPTSVVWIRMQSMVVVKLLLA